MIDQNLRDYLAEELGKRRSAILRRRAAHEAGSKEAQESQEIELEERAQEERIAGFLDQLADRDQEQLRDRLFELIREDGQVDTDELEISTRNGVVFLEGAVPSEVEHEILLNILTDVAGIREIQDSLEIQRLAWEREDRFKEEAVEEVQPGTIQKYEPYGGTEDPVLADEEGIDYEPPINQPPPIRKG